MYSLKDKVMIKITEFGRNLLWRKVRTVAKLEFNSQSSLSLSLSFQPGTAFSPLSLSLHRHISAIVARLSSSAHFARKKKCNSV